MTGLLTFIYSQVTLLIHAPYSYSLIICKLYLYAYIAYNMYRVHMLKNHSIKYDDELYYQALFPIVFKHNSRGDIVHTLIKELLIK